MAASWADEQVGDGVVELVIGITNPDPVSWQEHPASSHRHRPDANPFTYWERHRMIESALRECLLTRDTTDAVRKVIIVPFPLDRPEAWFDYIPQDTRQFVRAFSPWERSKAEALSAGGYEVTLLEGDAQTVVRASDIRARWRDLDAVRADLPDSIAREVERLLDDRAFAPSGATR